jgi:hypothetical protein
VTAIARKPSSITIIKHREFEKAPAFRGFFILAYARLSAQGCDGSGRMKEAANY